MPQKSKHLSERLAAVLELFSGKTSAEGISQKLSVSADELQSWKDAFLAGGQLALANDGFAQALMRANPGSVFITDVECIDSQTIRVTGNTQTVFGETLAQLHTFVYDDAGATPGAEPDSGADAHSPSTNFDLLVGTGGRSGPHRVAVWGEFVTYGSDSTQFECTTSTTTTTTTTTSTTTTTVAP